MRERGGVRNGTWLELAGSNNQGAEGGGVENVVGDGSQSLADFGGAGAQFQCIDRTIEPRS